ncbi:hypothetical protein CHARACLAT_026212, partial [Characodon lateralis]|nr:hypothetical protein [Characodon lateralis]
MYLEVLALLFFLERSCLSAPQQPCHPGDEFLGRCSSSSRNAHDETPTCTELNLGYCNDLEYST